MSDAVLYFMPTCPFCQKVITFMRKNGIQMTLKNTLTDQKFRQELLEIGGKTQVPCLVIHAKALYESDDIIKWLKENWSKTQQKQ